MSEHLGDADSAPANVFSTVLRVIMSKAPPYFGGVTFARPTTQPGRCTECDARHCFEYYKLKYIYNPVLLSTDLFNGLKFLEECRSILCRKAPEGLESVVFKRDRKGNLSYKIRQYAPEIVPRAWVSPD